MNPIARALEVLTRPAVVLGLRVVWDIGFGLWLVFLSRQAIVYQVVSVPVGLATVGVGVWTLTSYARAQEGFARVRRRA